MAYERLGCKSQMPSVRTCAPGCAAPAGRSRGPPGGWLPSGRRELRRPCSAGSAAMTGAHEAAFNAEKPALLAAEFFRTPLRKEIIPRSELGQRLVHAGLRFVA